MLIEIAKKQKGYMPELSFGTHFFQDLVEASIRYLPLYMEDPGTVFKENLILNSKNMLPQLVPEFRHLSSVIRVIQVADIFPGHTLQVWMNADKEEAIAAFSVEKS